MRFDDIVGNDSAKNLLKNILKNDCIGHAYIFKGKRGTGRFSTAKAFAAEILNTDTPESHPDFIVVTNRWYDPSKKQENLSVDTIRAMKKDVYIKPYSGRKKIYVIPKADKMPTIAQNSILKVFEEPPEYCVIIMLAENTNVFLPTVMSRASVVEFAPAGINAAAEYLENIKGFAHDRALKLAVLSGGTIGRALELAEDKEVADLREKTIDLFIGLSCGSEKNIYDFVSFMKKNKPDASFIFEILTACGDDLMHMKLSSDNYEIKNADKKELLHKACGKMTRNSVIRLNETIINYGNMMLQNVNYPTAVLCMASEFWEEMHDRNSRS